LIYREARPEDLGPVMELCWGMHEETGYSRFGLNREKAEAFVSHVMDWGDGFVGVAEEEGLVVGVIVGAIQPFWFSDELEASELLLYVLPSSRGGFVVKRVVELFEAWSVARGCSRVVVGISSGDYGDRKGRFMERIGFESIGGLYAKDVV